MEDKDREEMATLIADKLSEHKKEKSWFGGLNMIYKALIFLVAFGGTVSSLGIGIDYLDSIINHEEIAREKLYRERVDELMKADELQDIEIEQNKKSLDTLNIKNRKGANFYAVGYRAEKKPDGTIVKHYRDWNGNMYQIFPDPAYSNFNFTYWFYNNQDGTKEYTFGK